MKYFYLLLLSVMSFMYSYAQTIEGELRKWHRISISMPFTSNDLAESPETFSDHRMDVIFTAPNGDRFRVPGFFDADGDAANTSAATGRQFKAYLRPTQTGLWTYKILYYTGNNVALMDVASLPSPTTEIDGTVGTIIDNNKSLPDLRAQGRLTYLTTGTNNERRYLQFAETGEYFLKIGPDSPENLFNYIDFDHEPNNKVNPGFTPEHRYEPHAANFLDGNPTWGTNKGKNLIGVINYLKSQRMNSISLSLYGGDDRNVFPWTVRNEFSIFDVSKLSQWEIILNYAEQQGLVLHLKLAENENWDILTSNQLRLYYREMIARFGHHLGIEWNISEEYRGLPETAIERIDFLAANDPWQNPRVIHTYPGEHRVRYEGWLNLNAPLTGASIQSGRGRNYRDAYNGDSGILTWINASKEAGIPWVVASDEQNPGSTGIFTSDAIENDQVLEEARTRILWKTHLAGGQGVMWYGGSKGDFRTENFNRFNTLFEWSRFAVNDFFKLNQIEFWKTENRDDLISGGANNNCLAEVGSTYVVYLEQGGTANLNLTNETGTYSVKWFNPRTGGVLVNGSVTTINGGSSQSIGTPPNTTDQDWVALVRLAGSEPAITDTPEIIDARCTFTLDAIDDFPNRDIPGFVRATPENSRGSLSVNSTRFPDEFAAATTTFTGITGRYKLRIHTIAEEDGESTYRIVINNQLVATHINPTTTQDFEDTISEIFEDILIQNGDEIRIEFNSTSNGLIPENGGFAFARGRWTSLEIFCPSVEISENNASEGGGRGDLCEFDFEEVNGIAILEAESIDISNTQWERRAVFEDFTGTSYIEWTGPNSFGTPGQGLIEAKIKINTPGKYRFRWRSRVGEGNNSTESNDSWLRFPDADNFFGERMRGGTIVTVFPRGSGKTPTPMGASSDNWFKAFLSGSIDWTFTTSTSDNDAHQIFVQFDNPGIYTMQISGRSRHHLIDRITLSRSGNPTNLSLTETRCPEAPAVPGPPEPEPVSDCSAPPSNFNITGTTATSATFVFDNTPDNTRRFELRAFLPGEFTGALGAAAPRAQSFSAVDNGASSITINGLTEGITYEFVLRAVCQNQTPRSSRFVSITSTVTGNTTTPSDCSIPPSNFDLTRITSEEALFTFDTNADDTRVIEVRAYLTGTFTGDFSAPAEAMTTATNGQNTVTLSTLEANTSYDFVIRALCNGQTPAQSEVGALITAVTENTTAPVDIVAPNNFRIQVTGESCPISNDGTLVITVENTVLNYTAKISSSALTETIIENFQNGLTLENLSSGTYRICFTIIEQVDFMQCFDVEIKAPENLSVAEELFPSAKLLNLTLNGGEVYEIQLNEQTFFTTENSFSLNLETGENNIKVIADRDCQGSFSRKIFIPSNTNTFSVFPNPASNQVTIQLPKTSNTVAVTIFDITGKVVKSEVSNGNNNTLNYTIDSLKSGIYFMTIQGEAIDEKVKLIKK